MIDLGYHLLDGHLAPDGLAHLGVTRFRADAAALALGPIGDRLSIDPADGVVRARVETRPAADAAILAQDDFALRCLAFRVVAPPAAERAAFEEDGSADAGAVVNGIFLDVENQTVCHGARINAMARRVN